MVLIQLLHKRIILFSAILLTGLLQAQAQNAQRYWVYFQDKEGSGYTLEHANEFLSRASLERRERQGIALTNSDLPVSGEYLQQIAQPGVHIRVVSRWLNAASVEASPEQLAMFATLPFVKKIEPVRTWRQEEEKVTDLSTFRQAADETSPFGQATVQNSMIGLEFLHDMGYRGENMTIAVLDGGFAGVNDGPGFAKFFDNEQILGTWNFPDANEDVYFSSLHGSYVLSIIGAELPGTYLGASPDADFYLLRTEVVDSERVAEEDFWLAGAEYADFIGADIINSSLGYTTFDEPSEDHTYADMDGNTTVATIAADMAASKGILVCNSAGNSGSDDWTYIGAPADGDSVFSIGAVDADRQYAFFSSRGPTFDGRVKPNISVMGENSAIVDPSGIVYIGSGTSFSSPLAAGASACLWQAFPDKTNWEIMQALQQSATRANDPDDYVGYGIPNLALAWFILKGTDFDGMPGEMVSIFPNPAPAQANVAVLQEVGQNQQLLVHDMQGQLVWQYQLTPASNPETIVTIDGMEAWERGMYLLSLAETTDGVQSILETITFVHQ